jgi:Tol biopolymer transport system component
MKVTRPKGDWLGQEPPGETAKIFAPGIVSTGLDELNALLSHDGRDFIFSIKSPRGNHYTMVWMTRTEDSWSLPEVLPFSGHYSDADPAWSPDGRWLYFLSRRPHAADTSSAPREDFDIWRVERLSDGWDEPANIGPPINTTSGEVYPSFTSDGDMYFSSRREGGMGRHDVYHAAWQDGKFSDPVNLGPPVNSEYSEGDSFIAPDGSYLIITISRRPDSHGSADLYVSFRSEDGSWTEPVNLGEEVNTSFDEYCPYVSPDGKYLFFTSYRSGPYDYSPKKLSYSDFHTGQHSPENGFANIYWIDFTVVEQLRPN